MLDMLQRALDRKRIRLLRMDGSVTAARARHALVAKFQSSTKYPVFLLSSKVRCGMLRAVRRVWTGLIGSCTTVQLTARGPGRDRTQVPYAGYPDPHTHTHALEGGLYRV